MLSDPVYLELIAYFKNGGVAAVNVNADRFDALCVSLTGSPAASLPAITATNLTETQAALASIYYLMTNYINQLQSMYDAVVQIVSLLSPTDDTITISKVETDCLEVLLPDFTLAYIDPWIVRAQQTPTDPTLPADMQAFYDLQVANFVAYEADLSCANQALTAMSNANSSSSSATASMPSALKSILSKILQLSMPFGLIGLTPGQEYKKSKKAKAASPAAKTPDAGSTAPAAAAETPTPPSRPMGTEAGAVSSSNVG